jgi:hypothetical protein
MESVISYITETQLISNTKVKWLMLFRKIIVVYSENNIKTINALSGELLNVTLCGIFRM